jgi:uncharacterized protein
MVAAELLEILVCPETHQAVRPADGALLASLNKKISEGLLRNRAGEKVTEPLEGGLLREDGRLLYPVRKDIPVMLTDEAIPIA